KPLTAVEFDAVAGGLDVALRAVPAALAHLYRGAIGGVLDLLQQALVIESLDAEAIPEAQATELVHPVTRVAECGAGARPEAQRDRIDDQRGGRPLLEGLQLPLAVGRDFVVPLAAKTPQQREGSCRADKASQSTDRKCELVHTLPRNVSCSVQ